MALNLLRRKDSQLPAKHQASNDPFGMLRREMNRLFEDFSRGFDMAAFEETEWMPQVDISESDKEIRVTAELPGLDEKDIDVSMSNDMLTIRGEKKEEKDEGDRNYHRVERSYGSFIRQIALPAEVQADKTEAKFSKGVLRITLPKSEQSDKGTKKIDVKKE
jgi:HSP20 family protein